MEELLNWVRGHLTTTGRIYSALGPLIVISAYFILGMGAYVVRYAVKGAYRDEEIESRGSSILAGMWLRQYFAWMMQPIWRFLRWTGIPANAVTTLSVLLAIAGGVAVAEGRFSLGGWLYLFAGICDFFDGRIARWSGEAGPSGAALDSVLDRLSDAAILVGLAWYYRDMGWPLLAVLVALVGSLMVPYVRAKGESLGVAVKVGVAQRAERILYLGVTVALSPIMEAVLVPDDPRPTHRLAIAGIVLMAISTQLTVFQRLIYLLRQLDGKVGRPKLSLGEGSMFRNLVAAFVATAVDFAAVNVMVASGGMTPWLATAFGCGIGAVVNFSTNRAWTFRSSAKVLPQASRYTFVSFTSALLNSGGVAVLLLLPPLDYRIAWILVRIAVFAAWNFPLHRDYVFGDNRPDTMGYRPADHGG